MQISTVRILAIEEIGNQREVLELRLFGASYIKYNSSTIPSVPISSSLISWKQHELIKENL